MMASMGAVSDSTVVLTIVHDCQVHSLSLFRHLLIKYGATEHNQLLLSLLGIFCQKENVIKTIFFILISLFQCIICLFR